jgi:chromosome segregation ATPase
MIGVGVLVVVGSLGFYGYAKITPGLEVPAEVLALLNFSLVAIGGALLGRDGIGRAGGSIDNLRSEVRQQSDDARQEAREARVEAKSADDRARSVERKLDDEREANRQRHEEVMGTAPTVTGGDDSGPVDSTEEKPDPYGFRQ